MGLQVSEINFSSKIFNFSHIFNLDQDGVNITKKKLIHTNYAVLSFLQK